MSERMVTLSDGEWSVVVLALRTLRRNQDERSRDGKTSIEPTFGTEVHAAVADEAYFVETAISSVVPGVDAETMVRTPEKVYAAIVEGALARRERQVSSRLKLKHTSDAELTEFVAKFGGRME